MLKFDGVEYRRIRSLLDIYINKFIIATFKQDNRRKDAIRSIFSSNLIKPKPRDARRQKKKSRSGKYM